MKFIYLLLMLFMTSPSFAQGAHCIPFDDTMGAAMLIKSKMFVIYQKEESNGKVDENLKKYISSINGSIILCQQEMQSINKNLISEDRKVAISKIVTEMTTVSEKLDTIKDNAILFERLDTLETLTKELKTVIQNKGKKRKNK